MTHGEGGMITPREYDYWKLIYSELVLLPDWSELSAESRAHKLLERIDEKLLEADAPPQRKALFTCPPEEKLKTARKMIHYFEDEENN
jgi:ferredoxin-NADP reductase